MLDLPFKLDRCLCYRRNLLDAEWLKLWIYLNNDFAFLDLVVRYKKKHAIAATGEDTLDEANRPFKSVQLDSFSLSVSAASCSQQQRRHALASCSGPLHPCRSRIPGYAAAGNWKAPIGEVWSCVLFSASKWCPSNFLLDVRAVSWTCQ